MEEFVSVRQRGAEAQGAGMGLDPIWSKLGFLAPTAAWGAGGLRVQRDQAGLGGPCERA